jgi:ABC-type nickel/cobalt efflux system permease component RcnA
MSAFAIRAILSGIIIALIALVGKKAPAAGALIASLPLISILGMVWLWRDTGDNKLVADHAEATFWYVLPSLPMFLLIPLLLRNGYGFWLSLSTGIAMTILLYLGTILIAARFGIRL